MHYVIETKKISFSSSNVPVSLLGKHTQSQRSQSCVLTQNVAKRVFQPRTVG